MRLSDDYFTLFGLPRIYQIDRAQLDERFRALQGKVHPDRFVQASATERRLAMQWSLRVNEAYAALKAPLARAAYLCELGGAPIQAERHAAMPAGFIATQIQMREALSEADDAAALERLEHSSKAARKAYEDALVDQLGQAQFEAAAQSVRALMFVNKFAKEIDEKQMALS